MLLLLELLLLLLLHLFLPLFLQWFKQLQQQKQQQLQQQQHLYLNEKLILIQFNFISNHFGFLIFFKLVLHVSVFFPKKLTSLRVLHKPERIERAGPPNFSPSAWSLVPGLWCHYFWASNRKKL